MRSLTVGELIEQLNNYPKDAKVEMSIQAQVRTKIGASRRLINDIYVDGKVYGVDDINVNNEKIVIVTGS